MAHFLLRKLSNYHSFCAKKSQKNSKWKRNNGRQAARPNQVWIENINAPGDHYNNMSKTHHVCTIRHSSCKINAQDNADSSVLHGSFSTHKTASLLRRHKLKNITDLGFLQYPCLVAAVPPAQRSVSHADHSFCNRHQWTVFQVRNVTFRSCLPINRHLSGLCLRSVLIDWCIQLINLQSVSHINYHKSIVQILLVQWCKKHPASKCWAPI